MNITVKTASSRSVRRAAMDCLARREHAFLELQRKLLVKCPDASEVEIRQALEQLRDENLLSDERFASSWVRYRQSRGYGYRHIRQDLQ
ncbi:MAG: regulatory protein RecX, partial [Pseudohongiellaceae bacterium]